ncbi:SIMPL domain-containing protein [Paenarthrobacter sp. Z7-10]|uniref:SIMPL domain-containing protein n=1 Tax=Paenarthrobacter sp. Z7-10 TaxID=2787635 RepID=UPI0022A93EA4|nr:SIMPL domain-containing protein [Paenarthrobacter sp. Z7-10]MCZ2403742.1 SIMPL domain-containing protein [Paenarthrobacter sp. Z7-10]
MNDSAARGPNSDFSGGAHITVTGRGSARQEPDILTLNIGIEARRASVREAYSAAAAALRTVLDRLRELGVGADDNAASALTVQAEASWQEGRGSVVTGYLVSSTLSVRQKYAAGAQDVVAAVVETGGNDVRVNGMEPAVSDPSEAAAQARNLAWEDARAQAEDYAALAGRPLGQVLRICQGGDAAVGSAPAMARASNVQALPLPPGLSSITAAVTVSWELI